MTIGVDIPPVKDESEGLALMLYHLRLAAAYYEATPDPMPLTLGHEDDFSAPAMDAWLAVMESLYPDDGEFHKEFPSNGDDDDDDDDDRNAPPPPPAGLQDMDASQKDWPIDGTCRQCGAAPRSPETGRCATCDDEQGASQGGGRDLI